MLRSFSYAAAGSQLLRGVAAPDDWEDRARGDVPRGLPRPRRAVAAPAGPAGRLDQLLAVFELEKAIYELRYELNNRPDWVAIPVAGIVRLLDSDL